VFVIDDDPLYRASTERLVRSVGTLKKQQRQSIVLCATRPVPAIEKEILWDALECGVEDILLAPLSVSRICQYLDISPSR
jgi:hypothetical protein